MRCASICDRLSTCSIKQAEKPLVRYGAFSPICQGAFTPLPQAATDERGGWNPAPRGAQLLAEFCGTERSGTYSDFFPALFAAAHRLRAASANLARPAALIFLLALVVVLAVRGR